MNQKTELCDFVGVLMQRQGVTEIDASRAALDAFGQKFRVVVSYRDDHVHASVKPRASIVIPSPAEMRQFGH